LQSISLIGNLRGKITLKEVARGIAKTFVHGGATERGKDFLRDPPSSRDNLSALPVPFGEP
jgi:hypothetical protein